jgi:hypothetical protein
VLLSSRLPSSGAVSGKDAQGNIDMVAKPVKGDIPYVSS